MTCKPFLPPCRPCNSRHVSEINICSIYLRFARFLAVRPLPLCAIPMSIPHPGPYLCPCAPAQALFDIISFLWHQFSQELWELRALWANLRRRSPLSKPHHDAVRRMVGSWGHYGTCSSTRNTIYKKPTKAHNPEGIATCLNISSTLFYGSTQKPTEVH